MEFTGYAVVDDQRSAQLSTNQLKAKRKEDREAANEKRKRQAEKLKNEGNDYFKRGRYVEAGTKYNEAAQVYGPRPIIMSNLAATYLKLEQYELAEWSADCALFYSPAMAKARFRRAMARKSLGMFKAAELDFAVVVKHHSNITEARAELIKVRRERKMYGDGQRHIPDYDEEFPPFDGEEWDPPLDSDTEDARHEGNGTPCRFYNHDGCRKGTFCDYSHAPDDDSVRNELGQNVCIEFLLGDCRYGAGCIYAHTKNNLPQGWWSTPEQILEAKKLRAAIEDPTTDASTIITLENTTAYGRLKKAKTRSRELSVGFYGLLGAGIPESGIEGTGQGYVHTFNEPTSQDSNRSVLLICLSDPELFGQVNGHLLKTLGDKVNVLLAENATQASKYLNTPGLAGVIVGDQGIADRSNFRAMNQLVDYVKRGGSVVFGGLFPTFISGNDFTRLFSSFGLHWERGSYFRTTFHVNTENDIVERNPSLVASYSMKASHIRNIAPESAIYTANETSRTQSLVFPSIPVTDFDESPAVCVRLGTGSVGYLGDVNAEEESTKTILAMLGLLDTPLPPLLVPAEPIVEKSEASHPTADKTGGKKKKKGKKGKKKNGKTVEPSSVSVPEVLFIPTPYTTEMTTSVHNEPFIMQLALDNDEAMDWSYKHSVAALKTKIGVKRVTTEAQALVHLSSPYLRGVFVTDCELIDPKYKSLLTKMVSYANDGGRLVFGGSFSSSARFPDLEPFFAQFQLGWKAASYTSDPLRLTGDWDYDADEYAFLPKKIHIKALFLSDVFPGDEVYRPAYDATTPTSQTAIALSHTDRGGCIGYIGDVNAEPCTTPCVLAMFDLLKHPRSVKKPSPHKFVIVLSHLDTADEYEGTPLFSQLKGKGVEVVTQNGLSDPRLADLLSSPDLQGVLVLDMVMMDAEWLGRKIATYAWSGGTVVFAGDFGYTPPGEFEEFLVDNFCLPWKISSATELPVKLNRENELIRRLSRATQQEDTVYVEGSFLYDVNPDAIVYGSQPGLGPERATHVPVAYAAVGNGHVAYFGHDEIGEIDTKLMSAILKL